MSYAAKYHKKGKILTAVRQIRKTMKTDLVRLQKYIAQSGITSRRKAEDLIIQGRVRVNDQLIIELGSKVDPRADIVEVDGQVIDPMGVDSVYVILNKPRGVMTTLSDPEGRETVADIVAPLKRRVYPVGRLDYLSEGLLIMTNDGDMAQKIAHPKYEIEKVYEVKLFGRVNEAILRKLRLGTHGPQGMMRPTSVRVVKQLPNKTWVEFRLKEGKNREIRRICEAAGVTIDKLKRVSIGALSVQGLQPGEWKTIAKSELLKLMGMDKKGNLNRPVKFISAKRTIKPGSAKKAQAHASDSDEAKFQRYKKENYYKTLKEQAESKGEAQSVIVPDGLVSEDVFTQKV